MLNIEKYEDEIKSLYIEQGKSLSESVRIVYELHQDDTYVPFKFELFNWLYSEYKPTLLTESEKEQITNILKCLNICNSTYLYKSYNNITVYNDKKHVLACWFIQDGYSYKSLEDFKYYEIEELGINGNINTK